MAAMVLTPIVFSSANYSVRVRIDGVAETLSFPVTVGRYYWMAGDNQADAATNGGVGDLLALLKTCLESHTSPNGITCEIGQDWRVSVSSAGGDLEILWTHIGTTLDPTLFGWTTADVTGPGGKVAPYLARGIFRPEHPISHPDTFDRKVRIGGVSRAMSGRVRVSNFGVPPQERDFSFKHLLRSKVLEGHQVAGEPYGAFESHWHDSIRIGRPFRVYADEDVRTANSYTLYTVRDLADPISMDADGIRWSVDLKVAKYV